MSQVYETLLNHFDSRGLKYSNDTSTQTIHAGFSGTAGSYRLFARVDPEDDLLQVFGFSPMRIPEGSRPAVAEAITRANYGMKIGKFEMDFSDGELRFQSSSLPVYGQLEDEVICQLIGVTLAMLEMYMPAILSVIYGNEPPAAAIACVEAERVI